MGVIHREDSTGDRSQLKQDEKGSVAGLWNPPPREKGGVKENLYWLGTPKTARKEN